MEYFADALQDPESGLTYQALTGQRKQSVRDAERLFSAEIAKYMKGKGHDFEAKFITVILNWRRSSDERGLIYDFSTLEVNSNLQCV